MEWVISGLLALIVFLLFSILRWIETISVDLSVIRARAGEIQQNEMGDVIKYLDELKEDARDISQMLSRGKAIVTTKPMWGDDRGT